MKPLFMIILLVTLSACGKQTVILPTETPIPTLFRRHSVPTSTSIPVTDIPTPLPTPLPTQPIIPIITPDAIQVERWKEYEDALASAIFKSSLQPEEVVCEWEILGQSEAGSICVDLLCKYLFCRIFSKRQCLL